ncbi:hypothetical protein [Thalassovita taeanensis]|uniref:Uncharacterized protein n=1 Tax=Thalassovita taeanensis TaxID=657014 RepID=A0A1H9JXB9_9RHOB|nr:hypothetical protein [Thalassovita taeanensis]SEQ91499.1 hypothetical protein SAMN04488092_11676 [Thalassovita taeanensis]
MVDLSSLPRLLAAENWPAAEKLLRRAAGHKNAPAQVFYNLAKVIEAQGGAGLFWLKRAVRADPRYAVAWFELGRGLIDARDLPGAEAAFAKAALLDPSDAEAWRNLLRLRLRLSDWARARGALGHLPEDMETRLAAYRIAAELGEDVTNLRAALLADPAIRPEAIKALTRTAKGQVPLRFPTLQAR